jgi:hypothetical protein
MKCNSAVFVFRGWVVTWYILKRSLRVEWKADNTHKWRVVVSKNREKGFHTYEVYATHPTQHRSAAVIRRIKNH